DAAMFQFRRFAAVDAEVRRYTRIAARQVWTDDGPTPAAACRLEEDLSREEQHVRIGRREDDGRGSIETIFSQRAKDNGADVLHLTGLLIVPRDFAAVDNAGMQRIGRRVAVLPDADRMPLPQREFPVIATARHTRRAHPLP